MDDTPAHGIVIPLVKRRPGFDETIDALVLSQNRVIEALNEVAKEIHQIKGITGATRAKVERWHPEDASAEPITRRRLLEYFVIAVVVFAVSQPVAAVQIVGVVAGVVAATVKATGGKP